MLEVNGFQTLRIEGPFKKGQHIMCDGKAVYLCDQTWNKLKEIDTGNIPTWEEGENKFVVRCDFSGSRNPSLEVECKFVGEPVVVAAKN